jgi:predicted small lipoprotein YifL
MKRLMVVIAVLALAACGKVEPLRPQAGKSLPPKPAVAARAPDAEALITPSDQSRPKRNDELLQSSEKRPVDKFDLPPSG